LFRKLILALKEGNIDAIRQEIIAYISHFIAYWGKYLGFMRFYLLEQNISRN